MPASQNCQPIHLPLWCTLVNACGRPVHLCDVCAVCVQVTQLSSKGELPGRLTATPGAKLRPDVDEYLVKHGVMAALNEKKNRWTRRALV